MPRLSTAILRGWVESNLDEVPNDAGEVPSTL